MYARLQVLDGSPRRAKILVFGHTSTAPWSERGQMAPLLCYHWARLDISIFCPQYKLLHLLFPCCTPPYKPVVTSTAAQNHPLYLTLLNARTNPIPICSHGHILPLSLQHHSNRHESFSFLILLRIKPQMTLSISPNILHYPSSTHPIKTPPFSSPDYPQHCLHPAQSNLQSASHIWRLHPLFALKCFSSEPHVNRIEIAVKIRMDKETDW